MNIIVGDAWDVISINLYIYEGEEGRIQKRTSCEGVNCHLKWQKLLWFKPYNIEKFVFLIMTHMDLKTLMGFLYSNCVNHDKLRNVFIDL